MTAYELNYHELLSSSSVETDLSDLLCKTCRAGSVLSVPVAEVTRLNSQDCGKLIVCSCMNLLW